MNVHGLSDIRPSKGTFDGKSSRSNLWQRFYKNGPSGCRPPVLTLDKTHTGGDVHVYTGCAASPSYFGPDGTQWRLRTSYRVVMHYSKFEHGPLPTRISVTNPPEPRRPYVQDFMSRLALWPSTSHDGWDTQVGQQHVRTLTDQGSGVNGLMETRLASTPVSPTESNPGWTLRDGLVDHLVQDSGQKTEWTEGAGYRVHPKRCPVPITPNSWAAPGTVKDYHVQIRTGGSYDTRDGMSPVVELLKSKAPELDEPFALTGYDPKEITVSDSPLVKASLVPAHKDRFEQHHGTGRRLGN